MIALNALDIGLNILFFLLTFQSLALSLGLIPLSHYELKFLI